MDENQKLAIAVKLLISQARQKGVKLEPWEIMERKLKQLSHEIGITGELITINFVMDMLRYMLMLSFATRLQEDVIAKQLEQVLASAKHENVAIKILKFIMAKEGVHLKLNKRRLNEVAEQADIPPAQLIEFLKPILHELVDQVIS